MKPEKKKVLYTMDKGEKESLMHFVHVHYGLMEMVGHNQQNKQDFLKRIAKKIGKESHEVRFQHSTGKVTER